MYRLFSLSALLIFLVSGDPRTPKIYNVLISTKKNLSPSHAHPVYEPVLRTTSLGIALTPLFYQSPHLDYQTPTIFQPNFIPSNPSMGDANKFPKRENEFTMQNQGLQPLPVRQYIPYSYLSDQRYYPEVAQSRQTESNPKMITSEQHYQKAEEDPRSIIANLKRNPNIPDVPPPALPVRNA